MNSRFFMVLDYEFKYLFLRRNDCKVNNKLILDGKNPQGIKACGLGLVRFHSNMICEQV